MSETRERRDVRTDAMADAAYYVWGAAHEFDADAIRTGRCSLGKFPTCSHRLTLRESLRVLLTHFPDAATWQARPKPRAVT